MLVKIPGDKARRYLDTVTGRTVSRHIAEIKPVLQSLGYKDAHQRADTRKQFGITNISQEKLLKEARDEKFSRKSDGKFADFLRSIGRKKDHIYDIGETPKDGKR